MIDKRMTKAELLKVAESLDNRLTKTILERDIARCALQRIKGFAEMAVWGGWRHKVAAYANEGLQR